MDEFCGDGTINDNGAEACDAGACVGTSYGVTGLACNSAVVGKPYPGAGTDDGRIEITRGASSTGAPGAAPPRASATPPR